METLISQANEALKKIREDLKEDVIKDKMIHTLIDIETCESSGILYELFLSTKYRYTPHQFNKWTAALGADDCFISVKKNTLVAKFYIHKNK